MRNIIRVGLLAGLPTLLFSPQAVRADPPLVPVRLQLKWVDQAQFAGYYAALDLGYYRDQGLTVTILPGGPNIVSEQAVESGQADFGIDFLPALLAARDSGLNLVNIAQMLQRSGTREISFRTSNIHSVEDLKGHRVGVWLGGNQFELFSALVKHGLDPQKASDLTIVSQPFDMSLLLNGKIDAASAMTYNELAQVLETVNPATGKLYSMADLNVIDFNQEETAMLQDGIFASGDWLALKDNTTIAERFLAASFEGWAYCRDNQSACVDMTIKRGGQLALPGHQAWMMNEINKLMWPNVEGIGVMDQTLFDQTATIAHNYGIISQMPDSAAHRVDLTFAAFNILGVKFDRYGAGFKALALTLNEGGR